MRTNLEMLLFPFVTALVMVTSCGEDRVDVSDPDSPAAQQVELCEQMCVKPLCSGVIDPGPDYEAQCANGCEMIVSRAEEQGCFDQYQSFLECLEGLSCEDTLLWFDQTPGYPCRSNEDILAVECEIEVRNAGG
jgi:hypothetical protein